MNPKNNIDSNFQIQKPLKIEDDNPRQFDQVLCSSVNVKNAKA